jgi:DNA-binding MarR family transcriptional regulator
MTIPDRPSPVERARCLAVATECTGFGLRKAARALSRLYDEALAPSGLRGTQFNLLVGLNLAAEVPLLRLADELGLDRTTLTRNLGPLERDGLVESVAGSDQRVRLLRLTDEGRRALGRAMPLWEAAQRKVVGALGKRRWTDLMAGLRATAALPARL